MKAAVFCTNALGDGLISLVLSNNLALNGWEVDTYQNSLPPLQSWIPHLPILRYPGPEEAERILQTYDWLFLFQDTSSPLICRLIEEGKRRRPTQTRVLYAYPSRNVVKEPYFRDAALDPEIPLGISLRRFCQTTLGLSQTTLSNGMSPPTPLIHRKESKRVVMHVTSGNERKNWPRERFAQLALHLKELGYEPVWIVGNQMEGWEEMKERGFFFPSFESLDALARYFYESGYFIGNDSGLGHLASYLNIPTLTLSRRATQAKLWAPSFAAHVVVTPPNWIPNIRGFRLRDKKWKWFVSLSRVKRGFNQLLATSHTLR